MNLRSSSVKWQFSYQEVNTPFRQSQPQSQSASQKWIRLHKSRAEPEQTVALRSCRDMTIPFCSGTEWNTYSVLPDKFSNCSCKKLFQVHKMFINLDMKQSATIWYKIWSESESVSEVVAYRISEDIRCLAPPGGENFTQPPDSLYHLA